MGNLWSSRAHGEIVWWNPRPSISLTIVYNHVTGSSYFLSLHHIRYWAFNTLFGATFFLTWGIKPRKCTMEMVNVNLEMDKDLRFLISLYVFSSSSKFPRQSNDICHLCCWRSPRTSCPGSALRATRSPCARRPDLEPPRPTRRRSPGAPGIIPKSQQKHREVTKNAHPRLGYTWMNLGYPHFSRKAQYKICHTNHQLVQELR